MKVADSLPEINADKGAKFLAENKQRKEVEELESGLQYQVINEGNGTKNPQENDQVEVHYRGTLINGETFDSSIDRGEPASFKVNEVIKGWTEALQLMKEGDKWKLFIPSEIAYGESGSNSIGPNETLIFDVELLSIIPSEQPELTQESNSTLDQILPLDVDANTSEAILESNVTENSRKTPASRGHRSHYFANRRVLKSTPIIVFLFLILGARAANVSTILGTGESGFSGDGGPAVEATIRGPFGVVCGPDDALYVCDTYNHCIRRVDRSGMVTTVAGRGGKKGYAGDGKQATNALLNEPYEVRFDQAGDMYFVEMMNHLVRKVNMKTELFPRLQEPVKKALGEMADPRSMPFKSSAQYPVRSNGDLYVCDIEIIESAKFLPRQA